MRKIALVAWDYTRMQFLMGLGKLLSNAGYNVGYFATQGHADSPVEIQQINASAGNIKRIQDFAPDRIIMFNGFAQETLATTLLLRDMYPVRVFHVEQGWLPQIGNIYISSSGTGFRSGISDWINRQSIKKENWDFAMGKISGMAKSQYAAPDRPPNINENYVLVPFQLEYDTSVLYDCPMIKTMKAVVQIASKKFPNNKVIVKPHPYEKTSPLLSSIEGGEYHNVVIGDPETSTNVYAKYAGAVLGLNSTSLIEALIHKVPVICLGKNVLSGTGVYAAECLQEIGKGRAKLVGASQDWNGWEKLSCLSSLQFDLHSPPDWVINYLKECIYPGVNELLEAEKMV